MGRVVHRASEKIERIDGGNGGTRKEHNPDPTAAKQLLWEEAEKSKQQRRAKTGTHVNEHHRPLEKQWQRTDRASHHPLKGLKNSRHRDHHPPPHPQHKSTDTAEDNKEAATA